MNRIEQEKETVGKMIELYCRHRLKADTVPEEYQHLAEYACRRLDHCRYGENKTACKDCPTHCYAPAEREQIREVMRWAGPRMLLYSPKDAIRHFWQRISHRAVDDAETVPVEVVEIDENGQQITYLPTAKEEKRMLRRKRLMNNRAYYYMGIVTRYMDRYYIDSILGLIPGWGDVIAVLSALPFVYFSTSVIKSVPLTLAVLNNALRDVLLGMLPFFVGDIIDIFHRSNKQNMDMIQGFVDGDTTVIKKVNQRAMQSAIALVLLLVLIALMIWLLISFGNYLYSQLASLF